MPMNAQRKTELDALCRTFRKDVIECLYHTQTGHPGGSLSVCEILTAIYLEKARINPQNPSWEQRDRVVLSKGHAAPMLYRILAQAGFFPVEEMATLRQIDTRLQGHPCMDATPGVDLSTGPLGLGLSAGLGMALSLRRTAPDAYVYVVLGDGEIQEGTVWEAAMSAYKFQADHVIAVLDWNGVQLDGSNDQIMPLLDIGAKFAAFGWQVLRCNGHDIGEVCDAIDQAKQNKGAPTIILARTVKGKGVSFMENDHAWHGKPIGKAEYQAAMEELGGQL